MKKNNIKIIGDIMLDEWYYGSLEKKSAEAKINIFERERKKISLGGAGNLCLNLKGNSDKDQLAIVKELFLIFFKSFNLLIKFILFLFEFNLGL